MRGGLRMYSSGFRGALLPRLALPMLLHGSTVWAQASSSAREQADVLFESGKAALKAGDWTSACIDFQRSRELDESPSTVVKIARCQEHDGKLLRALSELGRALSLIRVKPASDAHARELQALIQSSITTLEARLAHLRVRLNPQPSQATLLVDGQPLTTSGNSQTEGEVPMDPGKHTVHVEAAGYTASPLSIELAERQWLELDLVLTPVPASKERGTTDRDAGSAAPPTSGSLSKARRAPVAVTASREAQLRPTDHELRNLAHPGRTQRLVGYVTAGAGIALGAVAGYFAVQTRSYLDDARADDHCDANYRCDRRGLELIDTARDQQTNAIITGISSGILVATGIVLVATAPARGADTMGTEKTLTASVSPFGAVLGGQW